MYPNRVQSNDLIIFIDETETWRKRWMHRARGQKKFLAELECIKKNQTKLKNAITQMKNTQEGINGRINRAEEQISELEDKVVGITVMEE